MSNKHIENLTVRLLQALDKNYDVVNMDAVLSVIAALENTKITKEQLETTRLAKYINLFRRRTQSEQLAKRAKSLLKRWREMVGMQQRPLNTGNEFIRNESATSSNFQENINLLEGTPVLQQNPVTSSTPTTRNVYCSSATADKTMETHKNSGKMPNKSVPTSFSNVLAGFSGTPCDRINLPPSTSLNTSNGPSARRKNSNLKRNADSSTFSETYNFEHQSNSNSVVNMIPTAVPRKLNSSTEPIIIDIEDSNSGSNLIESVSHPEKEDEIVVVDPIIEKPIKHRKSKKDKKRSREKDNYQKLPTPLVVIDAESSLSQQSNLHKTITSGLADKEVPFNADDKSRNENLMVTNISEILALSNSSMSSVFPTSSVGSTKNIFSQHGSRPLSESELSFAGKFAQQSGYTVANPIATVEAANSENKSNFLSYNETIETKPTAGVSGMSNTFHPFGGTVCNSNESASNSQHSTFEIMDSGSQGNKTQLKRLVSELSLTTHRPKFATSRNAVIEKKQLSPVAVTIQPQNKLNTTIVAGAPIPEKKVPKKRGRKKGSKGIDSLIAKDTSLSSQMLMQSLGSGGKKVKTTKELYAEMQNRKLGVSTPTTPSHWTGIQQKTADRRDSFCSEPSLHSPRTFDAYSTNATVSTIATSSTPEKISHQIHTADIDSGSDSLISGGQSRESVTLVSIPEKSGCLQNNISSKFLLTKKQRSSNLLTAVENQLRELVDILPAVPSIKELEIQTAKETVPCTCKILEILPKQTEEQSEFAVVGDLLSLDALKASNADANKDNGDEPVITISVGRVDNTDSKNNTFTASTQESAIKIDPEKPKRSIFDLDFEDDEDPLHEIIAEVAAASVGTKEEADIPIKSPTVPIDRPNISIEKEKQGPDTKHTVEQQITTHENSLPLPAFPTYNVEEDEACLAKERFELQTQKITNFHIYALHNYYIPNINGNWNDALVCKNDIKDEITILEDGSNVVPKYCSFGSDEYIKKDLRTVRFERNFKPKPRLKSVEQLFYETPFLGVSRFFRGLKSLHRKTRKHRQIHEVKRTNELDLSNGENKQTSVQLEKIHNAEEPNTMVDHGYVDTSKVKLKGEESYDICEKMNSSSQEKRVFDNISINIDDTPTPGVKEDVSTETQTLLAIASNVNFNNNQINDLIDVEGSTTHKSCTKLVEQTALSNLKKSNDRIVLSNDNGDVQNNNNCNEKLDDSSCESHSSLKQTQKSINIKLRKQRRQKVEQVQNLEKSYCKRKRRRKKSLSRGKRQKIKCIKIAINGGITTQRHIKMGNSSDEDDVSESNSYDSDSSRNTHLDKKSDTEKESDSSEMEKEKEKDGENAVRSGESDWEQVKDATISEYECAEDDEDYEYDDDEDEELEDDEYSGEFHEVVTRDISPSSESGNNHIVLTIKKTPSKLSSPGNSLPPASPVILGSKILPSQISSSTTKIELKNEEVSENNSLNETPMNEENENANESVCKQSAVDCQIDCSAKTSKKTFDRTIAFENILHKLKLRRPILKRKRRLLRRKSQGYKPFRFPDELKHANDGDEDRRIFKKLHQQLFFSHEIFVETSSGSKRRLLEISSCSSSCAELSEYEYESLSDKDVKSDKDDKMVDRNVPNERILPECDSNGDSSSIEESTTDVEIDDTTETINKQEQIPNSEICPGDRISSDTNDELPEENNGLLASFNNIYTPLNAADVSIDSVSKKSKCDELYGKELNKSEKCDLNNKDYESEKLPRLEYSTGLRAVNEEVRDDMSNNSARFQQFKEWHQLLQLRSYNDEMLTVLPYVVLD